jgi:hypothetical protein
MATAPNTLNLPDDRLADLEYPQREAAFFYGLFLRGHSVDKLRADISVSAQTLEKWDRDAIEKPEIRMFFARMLEYRRHVLAIFDALVSNESSAQRLQ